MAYHIKSKHQKELLEIEKDSQSKKRVRENDAQQLQEAIDEVQAVLPGTSSQMLRSDFEQFSKRQRKDSCVLVASIFRPKLNKWSAGEAKQLRADLEVTKFIVLANLPFAIVENEGFIKFLEYANPHINIKAASTYSRSKVPILYDNVKDAMLEQICKDLDKLDSVAFTTDLWTSRANDPYMAFTLHYITADFELKKFLLGCIPFAGRHTGINIAEQFDSVVGELMLRDELQTYSVTDNGSNMILAAKKSKYMNKRIACADHNINLVVTNTISLLGLVKEVMNVCKTLSACTHKSVFKCERIRQACADTKDDSNPMAVTYKKIISPCPTRWNSQWMCMSSIVDLRRALVKIRDSSDRTDEELGKLIPTDKQFDIMVQVVRVLGYFASISEALSCDKTCSIQKIPVSLYNVKAKLGQLKSETFISEADNRTFQLQTMVEEFVNTIIEELEKRFPYMGLQQDVVAFAHYIDPSHRGVILKHVPHSEGLVVDGKEMTRYNEICGLIQKKFTTEEDELASELIFLRPPSPEMDPVDLLFEEWRTQEPTIISVQGSRNSTALTPIAKEMEDYLSIIKPPKGTNPIDWWKIHSGRLPMLSSMARHYLAIPASSASSERTFSQTGQIVNCHRTNLAPEQVDKLVFIRENLNRVTISKFNLYSDDIDDTQGEIFQ
jgi:hypothetical protein